MKLAGVDLAWKSEKNPSALAVGELEADILSVDDVNQAVTGVASVFQELISYSNLKGVAIDAPLIINNASGQRACEKAIGKAYGSRGASCHTSNTKLYPEATSVELASRLIEQGYSHLGLNTDKWQIECYPHPAIIEIFRLEERHKYKKGKVAEKRLGQIQLASYIRELKSSPVLRIELGEKATRITSPAHIEHLTGSSLKSNEDALDAILCLYIAGLYAIGAESHNYGDTSNGYIWVPQVNCM